MTNHPPLGLIDVFTATIPTLAFAPGVHVNYAETVLPMRDGLPKLKDFPGRVRRQRRDDAGVAERKLSAVSAPLFKRGSQGERVRYLIPARRIPRDNARDLSVRAASAARA